MSSAYFEILSQDAPSSSKAVQKQYDEASALLKGKRRAVDQGPSSISLAPSPQPALIRSEDGVSRPAPGLEALTPETGPCAESNALEQLAISALALGKIQEAEVRPSRPPLLGQLGRLPCVAAADASAAPPSQTLPGCYREARRSLPRLAESRRAAWDAARGERAAAGCRPRLPERPRVRRDERRAFSLPASLVLTRRTSLPRRGSDWLTEVLPCCCSPLSAGCCRFRRSARPTA